MTKSMNERLTQASRKNNNHKERDLRMESLEERQLLSVSPASAVSDDVDYACIAPADMTPMESAPVVEMNLTDEVPTLDTPVALGADWGPSDGTLLFCGYNFTITSGSATYDEGGNTISITGNATIINDSDPDTTDLSVEITCNGELSVGTTLVSGSSISMTGGALTVNSGCDVPTVNSSGITISGAGTIGTLNLNGATTVNSIGTITSATGNNNLTVKGGKVTGVTSNGAVSVSDSGTIGSYTSTSGSLSVGSGRTVADVYSSGASISGAGTVTNLHLNGGTTNVSVASVGTASGSYAINITSGTVGSITSSSAITCSGGAITTATTSGNVTISGAGTIGTLTMTNGALTVNKACDSMTVNSSGITITGTGTVKEVVLANDTTTKVNSGTVTTASGTGNITVQGGTVTNVTGTGATTISSGSIGLINNSGTLAVNGGTVGEVAGSRSVSMTNGTITKATGSNDIAVNGGKVNEYSGSGTVTVNTNLDSDSPITMKSGSLSVTSGSTVNKVNSFGCAISGDVTNLALTSGTTTVSAGTVSTVTGTGNVTVSGTGAVGTFSSNGTLTINNTPAANSAITIGSANSNVVMGGYKYSTTTPNATVTVGTSGNIITTGGAVAIADADTDTSNNATLTITNNDSLTVGTVLGNNSTVKGDSDGSTVTMFGYTFGLANASAEVKSTGTNSVTTSGTVTITSAGSSSIAITNSGALKVSAPLASGSTVTLVNGGKLTNNSGAEMTTNFLGYTFTLANGATFAITGDNIVTTTGTVTVTDDTSTADANIEINCTSGNLTVNTTLAGTSYVDLASGSKLSVASGKTVPTVNSNGGTFSGSGTITTLDLVSGTTTVSGGTVGSTTGSGAVSVTGGSITSATSTGAVSVNGGSIGTVSNSTNITLGSSGSITLVELKSGGATTTINGAGKITEVSSSGNSTISGSGKIGTLTLANGTTTTVSGTTIDATSTGTANLTVTGGTVTNSYTSGAISVSGGTVTTVSNSKDITLNSPGTIGTVNLVSGTSTTPATTSINGSGKVGAVKSSGNNVISGSGKIGTLTLQSGTTEVSGTTVDETGGSGDLKVSGGTVTQAKATGAVSVSAGTVGTVTNASGVTCTLNGKITTVTISGKTEVSANGEITNVSGTGATEITGGSIGTITNASGVECSGGSITTVNIANTTTLDGPGTIGEVKGSGAVEISDGTITTVSGSGAITATGGTITTASGNGNIDISHGTITTASGSGTITVHGDGTVGTASGSGLITISDGSIGKVTGSSNVLLSNEGAIGEISTTSTGTVGISGGTITTASGSGKITVDGGTIEHVTSGAAVEINGKDNADTITVDNAVVVKNASNETISSVTFDSTSTSNVTINAGGGNDEITVTEDPTSGALTINGEGGDDYIAVSAASNSGTLTLNGGGGNDVIATGGLAATVDGQGDSDLIIAGKFTGNAATLKTWNGDAAKALTWSLDGTLSADTVAAASASATVNDDSTDVLYYNTTGATPTLTNNTLALGLTSTSTTIIVTAANEADTSLSTITMAEAYAAMAATPGAYTLGFKNSEYIVNSTLPVYANTTEANKLTIDGKHTYSAIYGEVAEQAVTLKVGNFAPGEDTAYMKVAANTYVVLDGLTFTKSAGSQAVGGIDVAGTLKLTGGTTVSKFKADGIVNTSSNTVILDGAVIKGNDGDGIENTSTGTLYVYDAEISKNGVDGINNAGLLYVYKAKIAENTVDGIYSEGTAYIGRKADSTAEPPVTAGSASDITISGNEKYGIENRIGKLEVYNATIQGNKVGGVRNAEGGNTSIGTQGTGDASDVLILGSSKDNNSHGIAIQGGTVTVYNATISGNKGSGISNGMNSTASKLTLDGKSAGAILIGKVMEGDTTKYEANSQNGISNSSVGTVEIKKATINGNAKVGILNAGMLEIGTSTGGDAANVVISYNSDYGIENTSRGIVEEGVVTTPGLRVYNATINDNSKDGIYNHNKGTVLVGVSGRPAEDVQIYKNIHDGIDNEGLDSTVTVYNAKIYEHVKDGSNERFGINNRVGGDVFLYGSDVTLNGSTAKSIDIYGNVKGINSNGGSAPHKSTVVITNAYIHENTNMGILNRGGVMEIGTQADVGADDVLIVNNTSDGLLNRGGGKVTIYNVTISGNTGCGIYNAVDSLGSANDTILNLYGNKVGAIVIGAVGSYQGNSKHGIWNVARGVVDISNTTINGNTTSGIYNAEGGKVKLQGTVTESTEPGHIRESIRITNNSVDGFYNAADLSEDGYEIKNVYFYNNGKDGIENNGGNAQINIVSALITENDHFGIDNNGGTIKVIGSSNTDVTITNNGYSGIDNEHNGTAVIEKATISGNGTVISDEKDGGDGIDNQSGTMTIGTVDGDATDVVITSNTRYGVENGAQGDATLTIYKATIGGEEHKGNLNGGVYSHRGTVTIGTSTNTSSTDKDVVITYNEDEDNSANDYQKGHGVFSAGTGVFNEQGELTTPGLTIYNAEISYNAHDGIQNRGTAELLGYTPTSILIQSNDDNGIHCESNHVDDHHTLKITKATIEYNESHGIFTRYTEVEIGTQGNAGAGDVVIDENKGDGIENQEGDITIYNVTIGGELNPDYDIASGYGINNKSGKVYLYGNATDAILITENYSGGIQNMNGLIEDDQPVKGEVYITKATITNNGSPTYAEPYQSVNGTKNWGHGIYNRDGKLFIGTINEETGEVGAADDVVISNNARNGIENTTPGAPDPGHGANTITLYNVTIDDNGMNGINNNGYMNLWGTGMDEDSSIQITNNDEDGIHNLFDLVTPAGYEINNVYIANNGDDGIENTATGKLHIVSATIDSNDGDGIYNAGTIKVGIDGTSGAAEDVMITGNKSDGIENVTGGTLEVYDATITGNTVNGINNAGSMTLHGTGTGEDSTIQITSNTQDGIYNTAQIGNIQQYGLYIASNTRHGINNNAVGAANGNVTVGSMHVTGATIDGNGADGIYNLGTMKVGTGSADTPASSVTISNNGSDGIENIGQTTGTGATAVPGLTVYNADIKGNTDYGINNTTASVQFNTPGDDPVTFTKTFVGTAAVSGFKTGDDSTVQITGNKKAGIMNNGENVKIEVDGATIKNNVDSTTGKGVGIINQDGIANVGGHMEGEGTGRASTVQITGQPVGILNSGDTSEGSTHILDVSGAYITSNTTDGIGIHNLGGKAAISGTTADMVLITGNHTGILNEYDEDADRKSVLEVSGATITDNSAYGINNINSDAFIEADGDGVGENSNVQITENPTGILNSGADSNLTVSAAYITSNETDGIGIHNLGGNAAISGTTAEMVLITDNQTGVLNEYDTTASRKAVLEVSGATITDNSAYGIDNINSDAFIEADGDGVGENSNVQITETPTGILNSGADSNLTVSAAYITSNRDDGIGIHNLGGNAAISGTTAEMVLITDNQTGVLNEYDTTASRKAVLEVS
ncbi:MAG: hypothetical protein IJQ31_04145, partial [Thermoguttaceae bacterium]|nr:hypothetical protein [Thermoguttaceae bacterium]